MFESDFAKRRKRTATEALENHHKRAKHALLSRWNEHLYNFDGLGKHDKDSSRKTPGASSAPSTSRSLAEDRHSRRSQRNSRDLKLSRKSKHKDKGASNRQDGSRRRGFEQYHVKNSGNITLAGDGHEPRQARPRLLGHLFQETADCKPAAKYHRFDPRKGNRLGETFRETTKTTRHELAYPAEGVQVVYSNNIIEAERWLREHIVDCSARAVGFDIEWKPQFVSKKKGGTENKTAVLQLGVEVSCLVLHIYHMSELPKSLIAILRDEKVVKIGSGIKRDASKLTRDRGLVCTGLIDTQEMAKSLGLSATDKIGLKALAERFLGIELKKPKKVTTSNWENFPLKLRQIEYAALDAWIGLKIYQEMKHQQSIKDIKRKRLAYALS